MSTNSIPGAVEIGPESLHISEDSTSVVAATPVKRRGKSMSRRSGQEGSIEKSGKWYVVRWWMDIQGQVKRAHKRKKICQISGPGSLTESERKRRAKKIIADSGADTEEHFDNVVKQKKVTEFTTFREQAVECLRVMEERNREPVSPDTIKDMERVLRLWLNPYIGGLPLAEVNNGALKKVVAILVDAGKAAKTISTYTGVAKTVVASALNGEGEQLYPRKWNSKFIDLPLVKESEQNAPSFSSEVMTGLAAWKYKRERMLFTLCGALGPRVGKALGIEIDKHISADFRTIKIRQKVRHGKTEERLKTDNSLRDLDLHSAVAGVLKEFVGDRKSGFLFCTKSGKPLGLSNVLRRHLHPALKQLGYVNPQTENHKAGSHAFRRFRNTRLRNYTTECPEGLRKYWLGHGGKSMGELYDKIKEDVKFRKEKAESCGIGFELPSVVPNVPKKAPKTKAAKVA